MSLECVKEGERKMIKGIEVMRSKYGKEEGLQLEENEKGMQKEKKKGEGKWLKKEKEKERD